MTEDADAIARRLAAIVESSDDAIVSKDLNGIVQSWNQAAERMFGYTADEMIGASIRLIIPEDRQSEEDDVLASIRQGRRVDHFETVRRRRDGRLVPISLTVSPILDSGGAVVGASKIARDISDRKRAEQLAARAVWRDAFLAEATLILTSSSDVEKGLGALARIAVPDLADYCAFDMVGPDGAIKRLDGAAVVAEQEPLAEESQAALGDAFDGTGRAMKTRAVSFIPDLSEETVAASVGEEEERLSRLRALGVVSYLCVPLVAHGRALGTLTLANAQSGRRFTEEDVQIARDVATRSALAVETARSYHQLQNANRLKDEFLATLSHELRTPLNAIVGYARMLRSSAIADEKIPMALEVIDRNAGALTQIVEDVLDVSRIVLGKAKLRVQPTDMASVVGDAIATVTPAVDAKGLRLMCRLGHGTATVSGDVNRLQQVVWNLLSNSVKFTPKGGTIDVRVGQVDAHVEVVVSDSGIGFPASFRPHLFERFRQAESGTKRLYGGLGLGLAIAREIVELHGGTIDAESAGEGKGATFRVVLPLSRAPAGRA